MCVLHVCKSFHNNCPIARYRIKNETSGNASHKTGSFSHRVTHPSWLVGHCLSSLPLFLSEGLLSLPLFLQKLLLGQPLGLLLHSTVIKPWTELNLNTHTLIVYHSNNRMMELKI